MGCVLGICEFCPWMGERYENILLKYKIKKRQTYLTWHLLFSEKMRRRRTTGGLL